MAIFLYTTMIQKQIHAAHSGTDRLTHPQKNILTPPVKCSQQRSVLHWLNNSLIWKMYFTEFHNVFAS